VPHATTWDLAGIALFDDLEPDQLAAIAPWFDVQEASAGVSLTGEGAAGYSFFILVGGSAVVTAGGSTVAELEPGEFFGETAILEGGRRNATVTTTSPARLLVMFGTEFRRLGMTQPSIAARIEEVMRERLAAAG
jgi:CRP-like cAMP-binding protein